MQTLHSLNASSINNNKSNKENYLKGFTLNNKTKFVISSSIQIEEDSMIINKDKSFSRRSE